MKICNELILQKMLIVLFYRDIVLFCFVRCSNLGDNLRMKQLHNNTFRKRIMETCACFNYVTILICVLHVWQVISLWDFLVFLNCWLSVIRVFLIKLRGYLWYLQDIHFQFLISGHVHTFLFRRKILVFCILFWMQ